MEMGGGTHLRGGQLLCPCTDPVLASSAQERLQVWLGTASHRALLGPVQRQQRSPAKTDQFTDLCLTCPLFSLCKRPEEMCCFKYSTTSAPARYGLELEGAAWGVATVRALATGCIHCYFREDRKDNMVRPGVWPGFALSVRLRLAAGRNSFLGREKPRTV